MESHPQSIPAAILAATTQQEFESQVRSHVARMGRPAERGWHWPWRHSGDTGYTYAFDDNRTLIGVSGRWYGWQDGKLSAALPEPYEMPDMVARAQRAGPAAVLRWQCAVSNIVLDETKDIRLAIWGFLVVRLWLLAWHVVRVPGSGRFGTLRSGLVDSVAEQYLVHQLFAKLRQPEGQAIFSGLSAGDETLDYCVAFVRKALQQQWHRTLAGTGATIAVDTGIAERRAGPARPGAQEERRAAGAIGATGTTGCSEIAGAASGVDAASAANPAGAAVQTIHLEVRLLDDDTVVEEILGELAAVAHAAPPCAARPYLRLAEANGWSCPEDSVVEELARTRAGRDELRRHTDAVFSKLLHSF